jgi:hypothetical protein
MLERTHPGNLEEFWTDEFVARKTKRSFSAITLDEALEQYKAWRVGL